MDFERIEFAGSTVVLVREMQVERHLSLENAVSDLRDAFAAAARGQAANLPRVRAASPEHDRAWLHTLRARLADPPVVGGKDYASLGFDLRAQWVTVVDAQTGRIAALIEGLYLSRVRTAAASALATDLLAPKEPACLAHFGAGNISEHLVRGVLLVRPSLRRVCLVRRRPEAPPWLGQLGSDVRGEVCDATTALRDAEIVTTATSSREPVVSASIAMPGVHHFNFVGSNQRSRAEVDVDIARRFLRSRGGYLAVEDREQAAREAGDFTSLVETGELEWGAAATLGELLNDPRELERAQRARVTAFKSVGIGLMDLAVAAGLLRRFGLL